MLLLLLLLQRASAEDFDEEEQEALAAENEQEEELYDQVGHSSACFVTMLLSVHDGCQGSGILRPDAALHSSSCRCRWYCVCMTVWYAPAAVCHVSRA
jgi:hypothetical protein